jgi:hypothetical protein
MAVDERSRHELYLRLEAVLGESEAQVLMEHLPPVGWADVVTKHDLRLELEALEHRLTAAFRADLLHEVGNLNGRIDSIHTAIQGQTRAMLFTMVGSLATISAIAFGAARLL